MYTSFFGLNENPFNLTPDPRYLFLSPFHKEALNHLLYGIRQRKGFIVVTGGIGTGKTTMCRVLLNHLEENIKSALIFNSFISDTELLRTINQEFGINVSPETETKNEYINKLNGFLLENFEKGGNAIVLIDEAQNLSRDVLEQIRMLSNLETEKEKLVQVILMGQPELSELLASPSLKQLDERITIRYDLNPLTFGDIRGYIEHRLVVAGGRGDLGFSNNAIRKIFSYSQGNPRRINSLCDRALLIAYTQEKYGVNGRMIIRAIKDLHRGLVIKNRINGYRFRPLLSSLLLICLILVLGFGGWNFRNDLKAIFINGSEGLQLEKNQINPSVLSESTPEQENSDIFFDDKTSLAGLFAMQTMRSNTKNMRDIESGLSLVRFDISPEFYVTLKKPFRVRLRDLPEKSAVGDAYLLISETSEHGAVVINKKGEEREISREFILRHWGNNVAWVYPMANVSKLLTRGDNSPEVLRIQKILNGMGYMVALTGIYDESTIQGTMRFQKDFGLQADGITGPRTMTLLYQMEGWDEFHK